MNGVLARGLKAHLERPEWDEQRQRRGGEVLLALQNRCAMWGRTVVVSCYADGASITTQQALSAREEIRRKAAPGVEPAVSSGLMWEKDASDPRDEKVAAWLQEAGIRRIVVGHRPSGDSPAVLSSSYTGVVRASRGA